MEEIADVKALRQERGVFFFLYLLEERSQGGYKVSGQGGKWTGEAGDCGRGQIA